MNDTKLTAIDVPLNTTQTTLTRRVEDMDEQLAITYEELHLLMEKAKVSTTRPSPPPPTPTTPQPVPSCRNTTPATPR